MGDTVQFTGITTAPDPSEAFLEKAKSWGLDVCIIVGEGEDGELLFGGNISDVGEIVAEHGLLIRSADDSRNKGKFTGVVSCAITGKVLRSVENVDTAERAFERAKELARQVRI